MKTLLSVLLVLLTINLNPAFAAEAQTNTKTNASGFITEYRTEKFSPPEVLTDYTVQMDYIWGVSEGRKKAQVFLDDRIQVVSVGPSEVLPNTIMVKAKFRDEKDGPRDGFYIQFKGHVDWKKIEWCHIPSSQTILAPLRDPLLKKVREGKAKPPMVIREVKFN